MPGFDLGMPREIRLRRLFADISTADAFLEQEQKALAAVAALPPDPLLEASVAALTDSVVAAHRIDPLTLHWNSRTVDSAESNINFEWAALGDPAEDAAVSDRRKTTIVEYIPFSGPAGLFDMRPSDPPSEPVYGSVRQAGLALAWVGARPDVASVRTHLSLQEANLMAWVTAINRDVDQFNGGLRREVRSALKGRYRVLWSTAEVLAALGHPLRQQSIRREDSGLGRKRQSAVRDQDAVVSMPRRGPGRPGWTRDLFEERWLEACRLTPAPRTYPALARHFRGLDGLVGETTGDHLGRLRRRFPPQG